MEPSSEPRLDYPDTTGDCGIETYSSFKNLTAPAALCALERIIASVCIDFQKQTGLRIVAIHGPTPDLNSRQLDINTAIRVSVGAPIAEHRNG